MATDPVEEALLALRADLVRQADKRGEGPSTTRKSRFRSEMERQSFVEAHGQKVYDGLPQ